MVGWKEDRGGHRSIYDDLLSGSFSSLFLLGLEENRLRWQLEREEKEMNCLAGQDVAVGVRGEEKKGGFKAAFRFFSPSLGI